jgi:hypothetical protein
MRRRITQVVPAIIATTVLALLTTATPAQAHAIRVDLPRVFAVLSGDHLTLNVCKKLGTAPAWATVRYRTGSLVRYDAPAWPAVCVSGRVNGEVISVRVCEARPSGNYCGPFKPA